MFCVFCSHFFGNNLNMFVLWKLCEKLDYYNSKMDWCLKVSGHQVIVTSYETSDQVEGIKPSNNKPRFMKVRFIYTIFCDHLQGFM